MMKIHSDEENVDYPVQRAKRANLNWLSGDFMSFLESYTKLVKIMEPQHSVPGYISNFDGGEWLNSTRFATIQDGHTGVVKCADFLYRYGANMVC